MKQVRVQGQRTGECSTWEMGAYMGKLGKSTSELSVMLWVLWRCHEPQIASFLSLETLSSQRAVASLWELPLALHVLSSSWSGLQFELQLRFSLLKVSWDVWVFALLKSKDGKFMFVGRCQPWHGKLFSATFSFLSGGQHVNPAAQQSWSDLSNRNSLTFLRNYSYKILLNAEKMVVFTFFYKG